MHPLEAATIEALRDFEGDVEGFSVLRVGANTAKLTIDEHRAVDVVLNEAFAGALKASGKAHHLGVITAGGADPNAKATGSGAAGMSRYNRVKGGAEQAVRANGPAIVSIFRPAMIIGSQHTPWIVGKALPLFSFSDAREIQVDHRWRDRQGDGRRGEESSGGERDLSLPGDDGADSGARDAVISTAASGSEIPPNP